jgi:hypothetical protein
LYETQVDIAEHLSSGQKRSMLQNYVLPVLNFRAVKTKAYQLKAQSGTDLSYDDYVNLLLSAASSYDIQFAPNTFSGSRPSRRAVYSRGITEFSDDGGAFVYDIDCTLDVIQANAHASASARPPGTARPPGSSMAFSESTQLSQDAKDICTEFSDGGGDFVYDIDCTLDVIQANAHASASARPPGTARPPGSSMASSKSTQLSQDAKDIWDDLPDEAKVIILDNAHPPGRSPARPPFRNTNLHDVSAYDYILANIHDFRTGSEGEVVASDNEVPRRLRIRCSPMPRDTLMCLRLTSVKGYYPR